MIVSIRQSVQRDVHPAQDVLATNPHLPVVDIQLSAGPRTPVIGFWADGAFAAIGRIPVKIMRGTDAKQSGVRKE